MSDQRLIPRSSILSLILLAIVLSLQTQCTKRPAPHQASSSRPRLAVLIVIDQMRPDYLTRFAPLFKGGMRRILDSGAVFLNASHDHSATETAVGHTAIATGCFPSHNGIIGNDWYDKSTGKVVYSCGDSTSPILGRNAEEGLSPVRMLVPTVGDQLRKRDPGAMVYSVALKDRPAILMGGLYPNGAYWFDTKSGDYVTSAYYDSAVPGWLNGFNVLHLADSVNNATWSLLLDSTDYVISDQDDEPWESDGVHTAFPHAIPAASRSSEEPYEDVPLMPFADQMTLRLAERIVEIEGMGEDTVPDLLCIGCSAPDYIGHVYGPTSWEIEDYYVRLDGYLGAFFSFLDHKVGAGNYVVAVSSDHGVGECPEELKARGIDAGRVRRDSLSVALGRINHRIAAKFGLSGDLSSVHGGQVIVDYKGGGSITSDSVQTLVAAGIRALPWVADVFTRAELADTTGMDRPFESLYRHCLRPDRGPDLFLLLKEHYFFSNGSTGTTHGTAYPYDTNIPIIFWGGGIPGSRSGDRIRSIDIAPTLAALLGVQAGWRTDGRPLTF